MVYLENYGHHPPTAVSRLSGRLLVIASQSKRDTVDVMARIEIPMLEHPMLFGPIGPGWYVFVRRFLKYKQEHGGQLRSLTLV